MITSLKKYRKISEAADARGDSYIYDDKTTNRNYKFVSMDGHNDSKFLNNFEIIQDPIYVTNCEVKKNNNDYYGEYYISNGDIVAFDVIENRNKWGIDVKPKGQTKSINILEDDYSNWEENITEHEDVSKIIMNHYKEWFND